MDQFHHEDYILNEYGLSSTIDARIIYNVIIPTVSYTKAQLTDWTMKDLIHVTWSYIALV